MNVRAYAFAYLLHACAASTHMCTHMSTHMSRQKSARMPAHMPANMSTRTRACERARAHASKHAPSHMYVYTHACTLVYAQVCTHAYTYGYTPVSIKLPVYMSTVRGCRGVCGTGVRRGGGLGVCAQFWCWKGRTARGFAQNVAACVPAGAGRSAPAGMTAGGKRRRAGNPPVSARAGLGRAGSARCSDGEVDALLRHLHENLHL